MTHEKRSEVVEVVDSNAEAIASRLVGRTITAVEREPDTGSPWPMHANTVRVTLDDGAVLEFIADGHETSGLRTEYACPRA